MKKTLYTLVFGMLITLLGGNEILAQNVVDGVVVKERTAGRKPVPYAVTRESDIMWSKKIWRVIDLREKLNHPLYFPTKPIDNRMSLFSLIMYGIENEGLTPYQANENDEFKIPMTMAQVEEKFGAVADTTYVDDPDTGEKIAQAYKKEIEPTEVKQFLVKEEWYFDKNLSTMQVRILGLCPIRFYTREGSDEIQKALTFFIYFPEARKIFANHEVFNNANDANRITFDDIFHKRKFASYIIAESNVYDNRRIIQYTKGIYTMLEADKIKNELFEIEHDLWEF